jgi:argonaute-like protein implicated in RNA metabolism and viral defense
LKFILKKFFYFSDDTQREAKFKELELENERNKQVLTARIKQLQNELDLLVKEKKYSNDLDFFSFLKRLYLTFRCFITRWRSD